MGPPAPFFRSPTLSRRTIGEGPQKHYEWKPTKQLGSYEPQLEGPVATADLRGRIYWFSKAGPIFYDTARGVWDQPPGPVWRGSPDQRFAPGSSVPHEERINAAAVTGPDGKIYLIGGAGNVLGERDLEKQLVLLDSLEVYDPVANTYTLKAPMRRGRQIFAAEFGPDGKLYAFGGYGTVPSVRSRRGESPEEFERRGAEMDRLSRRALDSVEAYDPTTDAWTEKRKLPRPSMSGEAARCPDGRIYLVGGEPALNDARAVDDVWIYDTSKDKWTKGPSLRTARHGHGLVCTPDGKLYAIGGTNAYTVATFGSLLGGEGKDEGGPLASVEVLDTRALAGDR
jgi:N-acetylneuraminic acid mutarotase